MLKYAGIVLVIVSWLFAAQLLLKWRNKDLVTISHHAASNRKAHLLFILILVGLGLPFYFWLLRFLVPQISHPAPFAAILKSDILQFL